MRYTLSIITVIFITSLVISQDTLTLFYPSGVYTLDTQQKSKIDTFLNHTQTFEHIRIESHTDDVGTFQNNLELSIKRAQFTQKYINKFLVDSLQTRITASGLGASSITRYSHMTDSIRNAFRCTYIIKLMEPRSIKVNNLEVENNSKLRFNIDPNHKQPILLKNVLFEGGTSRFLSSSYPELDALVRYLKENSLIKIHISGHVCCTNNKNEDGLDIETGLYNLSTSRAKRTYDFLLSKGIDKSRLSYEGKKGAFPLGGKQSDNRRVEIEIVN